MRIAVTGGTGFLGSHLVRLLQEAGHDVRSLSRSSGHDIRRPETLGPALEGCRFLYHLAALVQSRPGDFEGINVRGVDNVLQAALEAGVERAVCVSSFTIFGPSGEAPHREENVPDRDRFFHGYDSSKYSAYRRMLPWRDRLPLNLVFPTVIYGPGPLTEGNILVHLLRRWARTRLAPLPGGGRPRWDFAFVEDVAGGLVQLLEGPPGRDFILGGAPASLRELASRFRQICGRRMAILGVPDLLFRASAHLEDWGSRLAGSPPLVIPHTAGFFLEDWRFSSGRASRELGYAPRGLGEGLELTWRWMKSNDLV